jgi:hypothetical protein
LIPLPPVNDSHNPFTSKSSRRKKTPPLEPLDPRQTSEQGRTRDPKPPTPPKTPTEATQMMNLPSQGDEYSSFPKRKDSRDGQHDLTALPLLQSPRDEMVLHAAVPTEVSPKTRERLFIVPDDDLIRHGPSVEPQRPSLTARVSSPIITVDRSPPVAGLTHRPTIKAQKSSMSLNVLSTTPSGPPPKGPLPDLPPAAREKELIETNRQLRAHIELLMEHLRYAVRTPQQ